MHLAGEMLLDHLSREHLTTVEASRVRPQFVRLFSHLPVGSSRVGFNADRLLNRLWYYPRLLRRCRQQFELFHIIDHSYAQLVSELPAERTIVTCHDLDAFRCLIEPGLEPRPRFFRAVAQRILDGLRQAARVVCVSRAVRDQIVAHRLLPRERVVVIPNGVHPACSSLPDRLADAEAARLLALPDRDDTICLLHVGSTIPRKRIDLLLQIFADLRSRFPKARLVHAGGAFTRHQAKLIAQLRVDDAVQVLPFVNRPVLAAIYRRAALLLLPSESEGFGLPVIESLACGTPVVASDLPVLREVGGAAVIYRPLGDVAAWSEAAAAMLCERVERPGRWRARRLDGVAWASNFSWAEHTNRVVALYEELIS